MLFTFSFFFFSLEVKRKFAPRGFPDILDRGPELAQHRQQFSKAGPLLVLLAKYAQNLFKMRTKSFASDGLKPVGPI